MTSFQWLLGISAAMVFIAGNVWWARAMRHLSHEGQTRFWRIVLWSKLFTGRENFTTEGWRYWIRVRWAAVTFAILWLSLGLSWVTS